MSIKPFIIKSNVGVGTSTVSAGSSLIVATGNVGIGTSTPSNTLSIFGGNVQISNNSNNVGILFSDGSFQKSAYPGTSGLVTSFSAGSTGFSPNMATNGAITLSGTLVAGNGGTGQSSYTTGDILYASNGSTLSKLAAVATGSVLVANGVGVAPSWGQANLQTSVTGTLPIANGGTNSTSVPSLGAVAYGTGLSYGFSSTISTASNVLVSGGGAAPTWGPSYSTTAGAGNIVVRDSSGAINIIGATVTGQTNVAVTTASTTTTTGAIITAGGVGVSGNINVGGVTNTFTGNVGIGTTTPAYRLEVSGSFAATTKSFVINHPTKPGMKLQYGSLESPYHGVRLTGEAELIKGKCTVKLPDYISGLCLQEGSQVQITNIKHGKVIWVESLDVNSCMFTVAAKIAKTDTKRYKFYWSFTAIRKDIEILEVEV